ncbi:hypothetical protein EUTSA_v10002670mg [Eutrema salsugineum]|uniref:Uncharacterized protein n=1 Tax=Eutrema salsugineum TaxID=72664 RepID=V4LBC9_EUTSA|nr:hypothetical protein EUTSA_v10002670mg [Eutrema salsugineum]
MAAMAGGTFGVTNSRISITTPTLSSSSLFPPLTLPPGNKKDNQLRCAVQESSTSAVATEKKDKEEKDSTVEVPAKKPKPAAAKAAVVKPLREMMDEDVIPPLKAILEAQDDISDLELSFQDDKLEGYFLKKGIQYSFWAFFPTGNLTGNHLLQIL